ncbi:MAG TPA: valine--tRNA ligase, partial [Bryobacteraceae bacterium]|nr:valine--tRNA ligase [Bryobacteraceae bacterium]
ERLGRLRLDLRAGADPYVRHLRVIQGVDIGVRVQAMPEAQRQRLAKEIEQLEKNIANSRRQLADETFLSRAPAHVIEGIRKKLAEYEAQLSRNREALAA